MTSATAHCKAPIIYQAHTHGVHTLIFKVIAAPTHVCELWKTMPRLMFATLVTYIYMRHRSCISSHVVAFVYTGCRTARTSIAPISANNLNSCTSHYAHNACCNQLKLRTHTLLDGKPAMLSSVATLCINNCIRARATCNHCSCTNCA